MDYKGLICEICGGAEFIEKSNMLVCIHCDATYHKQIEEETDEEKEARILRVSRYDDAEKELRMSPPHFDMAEDKFSELIKQYPTWSAGYWGVLRAKYGIKYEIDFDGKSIPSCYKSSYEDFREDIYFKKAVKYAETSEIKAKYQSEGDRIAKTCKEWREKAKAFDYDVFISFKASEDGKETKDLREMQNLYTYLTEQGYKVFFSPVSMRSVVGKTDWDAYIFNALEKASVMILYGSNVDYFSTTWIENEWTRYLRMIGKGFKNPDSLIVTYDGVDPNALPRQLRKLQALNAADKTFYITLTEKLKDLFEKEARQTTIDRIEVKGGKIGKKVNAITDTVEVMEAGTNAVVRKAHLSQTEVSKRNVATAGTYVPTANDAVQMGLSLLRLGSFFEADMFFNESINENKQNGTAWLGLLCTKLNDKELYDILTTPNLSQIENSKQNAVAILGCIEELTYAVEYAAEKYIAENILWYIFNSIVLISEGKNAGIQKLLSFILQYESNSYEGVLEFAIEKIDYWASFHSVAEYESICKELLKHISDTDLYISIVENIVKGYSSVKNLAQAKSWNDHLLEIDEGNLQAIYKAIYLSVGVFTAIEFKTQAQDNYSADTFIVPFLEKSINKISKEDAEQLLDYIGEIEYFCLTEAHLRNAEVYFDFISKYKFPSRELLLEKHKTQIEFLAQHHCQKFFEKYMAVMSHERVDWHISKRLEYADRARVLGYFDEAKAMYNTVLSLEEDNADALNGLFACCLEYNGSDGYKIKWEHFNIATFEKVLASCPNKRKQTTILKQYAKACVLSAKADLRNYDGCCKAFDQLIKYFPESESKAVFGYVDDLADIFVKKGIFDLAIKYANLSISNEPTYNIKARYVILLATLKCKTEQEFTNCEKFDKNMSEYKMLLLSCRADAEALQKYTLLAKKNEDGVALIQRQRQKALIAEQKKEEKLRADKKIASEKSAECVKRGLLGCLLPVAMIFLAIIGAPICEWDAYEEVEFAPVMAFILIIVVGIMAFVRAMTLFEHSTKLKNDEYGKTLKSEDIEKAMDKMKWAIICGLVAIAVEFFAFFVPTVLILIIALVLIAFLLCIGLAIWAAKR